MTSLGQLDDQWADTAFRARFDEPTQRAIDGMLAAVKAIVAQHNSDAASVASGAPSTTA